MMSHNVGGQGSEKNMTRFTWHLLDIHNVTTSMIVTQRRINDILGLSNVTFNRTKRRFLDPLYTVQKKISKCMERTLLSDFPLVVYVLNGKPLKDLVVCDLKYHLNFIQQSRFWNFWCIDRKCNSVSLIPLSHRMLDLGLNNITFDEILRSQE